MRKINQNVSFDIYRLGHERVLFMKLKMYPTFLIILCTGMKTNFDGFLKLRRRKNEPYQYDTTPIQNMRRKSELRINATFIKARKHEFR